MKLYGFQRSYFSLVEILAHYLWNIMVARQAVDWKVELFETTAHPGIAQGARIVNQVAGCQDNITGAELGFYQIEYRIECIQGV